MNDRPRRAADGTCPQCGVSGNSYHLISCSCLKQGHEWVPSLWDVGGAARDCAWCGKAAPYMATLP